MIQVGMGASKHDLKDESAGAGGRTVKQVQKAGVVLVGGLGCKSRLPGIPR